jgi:hypothetical protein
LGRLRIFAIEISPDLVASSRPLKLGVEDVGAGDPGAGLEVGELGLVDAGVVGEGDQGVGVLLGVAPRAADAALEQAGGELGDDRVLRLTRSRAIRTIASLRPSEVKNSSSS